MAANTQFRNQAYQAAESGIDAVLRIDPDILKAIRDVPMERPFTVNPTTSAERVDTVTTSLGTGECPGRNGSVGIGASDSYIFTVDSTSQSQRGGRANHQQGFCIPYAPSES